MKVPGREINDRTTITESDLNIIFGTKSKRRYIFEQINYNGKTIEEVSALLGIKTEEAENSYFSAYMRCKEYSLYKDNKTSIKYLKAIRKFDKKVANQLLRSGIYDLNFFKGKNITEVMLEKEIDLPVEVIYELCAEFDIPTTYTAKSVTSEEAIDRIILKMINKFGEQSVYAAFTRRLKHEGN